MSGKRKSRKKAETCNCLACRLQSAILEQLAPEDADDFNVNVHVALSGLLPTVALLFAGIDYEETEEWFRHALSERSKLMLPDGQEFGENYKGRA